MSNTLKFSSRLCCSRLAASPPELYFGLCYFITAYSTRLQYCQLCKLHLKHRNKNYSIFLTENYQTNWFHVAVHLFSCRSQMTKCGKNHKVAHKAIAEWITAVLTTFCSLLGSITEKRHSNMKSPCRLIINVLYYTCVLPLIVSKIWHILQTNNWD